MQKFSIQLRLIIFKTNILLREKDYLRPVPMMKFKRNEFLKLQPQNAVNVLELVFTVHTQTEKYVETISTPFWRERKHATNLVLQLIIFCIFTQISFIVSKSNFCFKGRSRIFTDGFNKINVSILGLT